MTLSSWTSGQGFSLFEGCKSHYVTGYNVPSYEYILFMGDQHVLNMTLIDHIFDDMLVEEVRSELSSQKA
jgi:oligosaccharyltransferase complex subunit alpha (ribophorin I)